MGIIYQFLGSSKALKCFKKMLQLAWVADNIQEEMNAYDALAIQYYYMGDTERSHYFHN